MNASLCSSKNVPDLAICNILVNVEGGCMSAWVHASMRREGAGWCKDGDWLGSRLMWW